MIAAFSISFHSIIISSIKTNFIHYSNLKLRKRIKLGSVLNCAILSFCKHCETLHILVGKAVVHLPPVLTIEDFLIFLGIISSWPHFCKLWKTEVWPASSCWWCKSLPTGIKLGLAYIVPLWREPVVPYMEYFFMLVNTEFQLQVYLFYRGMKSILITSISVSKW